MHYSTITDLAVRYQLEIGPHKKATTRAEDNRRWVRRIIPALGSVPIVAANRDDCARFHLSLSETPYEANRCLNLLSHGFVCAEAWGLRSLGSNPCRGIRRFPERPRRRYLSTGELAMTGALLDDLERGGRVLSSTADAIRLLFLTGARKSEVLALRWDQVDLEAGVVHLPDSKEGEDVLLLNGASRGLLRRRQREAKGPHVFESRNGKPLRGLQRAWGLLREAAPDTRPHDARKTYASLLLQSGEPLNVVGELLRHRDERSTRSYAYLETPQRRRACEHAGNLLGKFVNGKKRRADV